MHALIRLRKTEVDRARAVLAQAMAEEHAAAADVARCRAVIEREQREASCGQTSLDDFRLWLPAGEDAVKRAEQALHAARQVSDQARETLVRANAVLKAAQTILDRRLEDEREARGRREQAEIDDLSRRNNIAAA
nr:flagellar FliJ family protein [Gluconacetobacter johannae]